MTESKPKPTAPAEPPLEVKPVKDLEPDAPESDSVRGGGGTINTKRNWSDLRLKRQVTTLTGALQRLRHLQF
jgi:hypothetical protein